MLGSVGSGAGRFLGRSGATNAEIAKALFITEGTAKNHVCKTNRKLGLRDRAQLTLYATGYNYAGRG